MMVKTLAFKGKIFAVEPPMFVELEITYTEPGFSGNTAGAGGTKPAFAAQSPAPPPRLQRCHSE